MFWFLYIASSCVYNLRRQDRLCNDWPFQSHYLGYGDEMAVANTHQHGVLQVTQAHTPGEIDTQIIVGNVVIAKTICALSTTGLRYSELSSPGSTGNINHVPAF